MAESQLQPRRQRKTSWGHMMAAQSDTGEPAKLQAFPQTYASACLANTKYVLDY